MSKKALFYTINGSLRCLSAHPPPPSHRLSPPLRPRSRRFYRLSHPPGKDQEEDIIILSSEIIKFAGV